jgi:hypothetical protein
MLVSPSSARETGGGGDMLLDLADQAIPDQRTHKSGTPRSTKSNRMSPLFYAKEDS